MEPISTMVLWAASLVAAPATGTPKWKLQPEARYSVAHGTVVRDYTRVEPSVTTEMRPYLDSASLSEPVFAELLSYKTFRDGWDGEGSYAPCASDVDAAVEFVRLLKPMLPLPGAMLDPVGSVGLYWNTDKVYIDINFDRDGTVSFYLRDRNTGEESFYEGRDPKNPASLLPLIDLLIPTKLAA
jgi:hypothetical protein